jgi:hypothetical protein
VSAQRWLACSSAPLTSYLMAQRGLQECCRSAIGSRDSPASSVKLFKPWVYYKRNATPQCSACLPVLAKSPSTPSKHYKPAGWLQRVGSSVSNRIPPVLVPLYFLIYYTLTRTVTVTVTVTYIDSRTSLAASSSPSPQQQPSSEAAYCLIINARPSQGPHRMGVCSSTLTHGVL